MPPIADQNPLSYVGVVLVIGGVFIVLAGLGILKIKNFDIKRGKITSLIGLILTALGVLFLLPDIRLAIDRTAVPTGTVPSAPGITPRASATTMATIVQTRAVSPIAGVETPTSIPLTAGVLTSTSHAVACVTSQKSEVQAEVQSDTFTFTSVTLGAPGPKLPLANGQDILFDTMSAFEVVNISDPPYRLTVTITLLNGDTITDNVPVFNKVDGRLVGQGKYGPFSILLSDVKRVEFREGDCQ